MKSRWTAGLMALAVSVGLLFTGAPVAHASSKGRLNTTYALGAATIYSLLRGKTTQGLSLGAGSAPNSRRRTGSKREVRAFTPLPFVLARRFSCRGCAAARAIHLS